MTLVGSAFAAKPFFQAVQISNPIKGEVKNTITIPSKAVEVAPGIFYLGTVIKDGKAVEGYAFIDYKKNFGKPTGCNYDGVCQGWEDPTCDDCQGSGEGDSNCYEFLAKGAKWRTIEPYWINPSNADNATGSTSTEGLDEGFVVSNFAMDIDKWEAAAGTDILGDGSVTYALLIADTVAPDGLNEVYFGNIAEPGAVGITVIWGIFSGPPKNRELVEWDQVYDNYDYQWSNSGDPWKMDFESVATHELGHSVGLDDLYDPGCSDQTMYGYIDYGETNKRTLEAGDITGIQKLY